MNGLVANSCVDRFVQGSEPMQVDPFKTTLNEHHGAFRNHLGMLVHTLTEDGVGILAYEYNGDRSLWLCWKENGSIYLEDRPN